MRNYNMAVAFGALLLIGLIGAGCTTAEQASATKLAATQAGQLFCAVEANGGGTVVVGIIDAASSAVPGAAPIVALATGAAKADVDATCAAAGGVAVSPPVNPASAPQVAVKLPAGLPTITVGVVPASGT